MTTVSTSAFYERANLQLGGLRKRAESLQSQVGSGQRLARSSDDPVAAARMRELSRRDTLSGVDRANSDRAEADLKLADGALSSTANLVIRARELALQASNGTLSDTDRSLIAIELQDMTTSLLTLSNTRNVAGHALFGGEGTGNAYAIGPGGEGVYLGTADAPLTDLGEGQSVPRSLIGPDIFTFSSNGVPTDLFDTLAALSGALATGGAAASTAASAALGQLDAGLEKITTAQTIIGARLGWIETISDRRAATNELYAQEQSTVGGADLAATITRLQETLTVLEASQASFVRISNTSLFNLLR